VRSRRGKLEVYSDILRAVILDERRNGDARFSRVQAIANIPYDRFKAYLGELEGDGFVQTTRVPDQIQVKLTERGRAYLSEYRKVLGFLGAFGLGEDSEDSGAPSGT
jgi:predicted transcriptional regulator